MFEIVGSRRLLQFGIILDHRGYRTHRWRVQYLFASVLPCIRAISLPRRLPL